MVKSIMNLGIDDSSLTNRLKRRITIKMTDVVLLKNIINHLGCMGILPFLKRSKFLLLIPVYLVLLVCFTNLYLTSIRQLKVSYIAIGIYEATIATFVLFSLVCLKNSYDQEYVWNILFSYVEEFDSTMEGQRIKLEKCVYRYYLKFVLCNLCNIAQFVYGNLGTWYITDVKLSLGLILLYLIRHDIILTTLLLQDCFMILEKRYCFLNLKLTEVHSSLKTVELFWTGQQVKKSYLLLDTITKIINEIFGKKILLIIIITFLYLLGFCQFIVLVLSIDVKFVFASIFPLMIFLIFTISIINGCDKIEKKYSDLLWECSRLEVEIKNESVRNGLQSVENVIRNLPPVFTAAGFFRINRGLFSSLCSALVTYFIVIIQFKTVSVGFNQVNSSQLVLQMNFTEV